MHMHRAAPRSTADAFSGRHPWRVRSKREIDGSTMDKVRFMRVLMRASRTSTVFVYVLCARLYGILYVLCVCGSKRCWYNTFLYVYIGIRLCGTFYNARQRTLEDYGGLKFFSVQLLIFFSVLPDVLGL